MTEPTPRTDNPDTGYRSHYAEHEHNRELCRTLEREVISLRAQLAEAEKLKQGYYDEAAKGWMKFRDAERALAERSEDAERYLNAIFQMADDGWLMHGEEGMSDVQEAVYKIAQEHPEYKRRSAARSAGKEQG